MSHERPFTSTWMALVAIGLSAGCGAPALDVAPTPTPTPTTTTDLAEWPFRTTTQLGLRPGGHVAMGVGALDRAPLPPAPPGPPAARSTAARLLPTLTGGTFDRSYGAALDAEIAGLPESRRELGLAGVHGDALFGTSASEGLCEDPHVQLSVDGAEVSLTVPAGLWFTGALERDLAPLPEACVAELLAAGSVYPTSCDEEDAHAYFPEGSTCNECLAVDGDHARCVDAGECAPTATRQLEHDGSWYGMLRAPALLCAPDHIEDVIVLVKDLAEGDPLPETYDHGAVAAHCVQAWDGTQIDLFCDLGDYNAIGDVLPSRVDYIHAEGAESTWEGRISLVAGVEVEGSSFALTWLSEVGGTGISAPNGSVKDGWGINPRALRPGGVDPENPDDTYAREYIGAFVLKMATWTDGILVNPVNHNRCAEADWQGPHADGSYSCDEPGAWSTIGWGDDALVSWWDQPAGEIYVFPLVTLATTGLPDPSVPGGLLPQVLGSTTLADVEWEACAWPETFVPDRVRLYDPAPATSAEGYASFDGQTYRFGRDPDVDVRLFLATNQQRGFCPP
ncbi:MAG: hypothetical protein V4850_02700 [Myxococcota bacterium]